MAVSLRSNTHPPNTHLTIPTGPRSKRCSCFPPPLLLPSAFRAQWSKSALAERHESPKKDHRIICDKPAGLEYRGMSSYCFGTSSSITRSRPSRPALQYKGFVVVLQVQHVSRVFRDDFPISVVTEPVSGLEAQYLPQFHIAVIEVLPPVLSKPLVQVHYSFAVAVPRRVKRNPPDVDHRYIVH